MRAGTRRPLFYPEGTVVDQRIRVDRHHRNWYVLNSLSSLLRGNDDLLNVPRISGATLELAVAVSIITVTPTSVPHSIKASSSRAFQEISTSCFRANTWLAQSAMT